MGSGAISNPSTKLCSGNQMPDSCRSRVSGVSEQVATFGFDKWGKLGEVCTLGAFKYFLFVVSIVSFA